MADGYPWLPNQCWNWICYPSGGNRLLLTGCSRDVEHGAIAGAYEYVDFVLIQGFVDAVSAAGGAGVREDAVVVFLRYAGVQSVD